MARANGIELTYDTFGEATAPPMVLIMGLAAQMIAWDDEFCAALAARGFRVIRFDNRDIGLSTRLEHLGVPNVAQLLMAHFAVRALMHEAALKANVDPDRLSFLHAVRVVRRKLPAFNAIPPSAAQSVP